MCCSLDKKELRKQMKEKRDAMALEQICQASINMQYQLDKIPSFREAKWIYSFVALGSEPDTLSMIPCFLEMGKKVAVPKVEGEEMEFYEIHSLKDLKPGAYGILEPVSYKAPVREPGFMLIPGLAFDRDGNRLGYGGGFYDRYLGEHKEIIGAALSYDFQLVDRLPAENHDRPVDYIVTPGEIMKIGANGESVYKTSFKGI